MGFRTIKDGAILGVIQSLNKASQHAVFNSAGKAFTAISGGAIPWAFVRGEKSNAQMISFILRISQLQ